MELATALIWTLRILLPVILFCIYFKLQSPKEEQVSTVGRLTRSQLLARRKATVDCTVPDPLADIALKDASQAPALFAGGRGGKGGRRGERGERGDKPERGDRGEKAERSEGKDANRDSDEPEPTPTVAASVAEKSKKVSALDVVEDTGESKMHVETLLNFVAFNHACRQQRVFLPDPSAGPPPPPPPRQSNGEGVTGEKAEKANLEAQMVLRGSMQFKHAEAASHLYEKLQDQNVEVTEKTYTLMIETCLRATELKMASDFLLKMENSGHCPDSALLDKVMDLYAEQKVQREREKQAQAEKAQEMMVPPTDSGFTFNLVPTEEISEGSRAKLSSEAPAFVPSSTTLSVSAVPFVPGADDTAAVDGSKAACGEETVIRTKLQASSKPFQPQLNLTFDPYMYTWSMGDEMAMDTAANGDKSQGGNKKGKGKGKQGKEGGGAPAKGKEKGKAKESAKSDAQAKPKAKAKEKATQNSEKDDAKPKWKAKDVS